MHTAAQQRTSSINDRHHRTSRTLMYLKRTCNLELSTILNYQSPSSHKGGFKTVDHTKIKVYRDNL